MSLNTVAIAILVPPLNLIGLGLVGIALPGRWRGIGRGIAGAALASLAVLSLPITAKALLASLERGLPTLSPPGDAPQAIVVLGGDSIPIGEYPPRFDIGPLTAERLRTAAALSRRTGLPLLVSGGMVDRGGVPLADQMARSLSADFGVSTRWTETASIDTWENAERSAAILRPAGIRSIYLVTNGWHMRRALLAFAHTGLAVTAAPTGVDSPPAIRLRYFVPRPWTWEADYFAFHEWIGCAYYTLR